MLPKTHIIAGAIFAAVFRLIFPQTPLFFILVIFLSSFLIDVDHYFYYVLKKKDISLKNAYNYSVLNSKKKDPTPKPFIAIFHTIEFLLILIILSLFHKTFFYILIGIIFHLFLDLINGESFTLRNLSLYFAWRKR